MNKILLNYRYDLYTRYSPYSIFLMALLLNMQLDEMTEEELIDYEIKLLSLLPIEDNYCLVENILNLRTILPIVGCNKNLLKNISFSYGMNNLIFSQLNINFIETTDFFLNILHENFFYKFNLKREVLFLNFKFIKNSSFLNIFLQLNNKNNYYFENNFLYLENDNTKFLLNNSLKFSKFNSLYNKKKNFLSIKIRRFIFKSLNNIKLRQSRLSFYIKKIQYYPKLFIEKELNLVNLLCDSFNFTKNDCLYLIENKYVFINGKLCLNKNLTLELFDRIQLVINTYIFIKKRVNFSYLIKNEINLDFYFNKFENVKNSNINNLVNFNLKYFKNIFKILQDNYNFIEIDYSILLIFIINIPKKITELNLSFIYFSNLYTIKFLNWNYLY